MGGAGVHGLSEQRSPPARVTKATVTVRRAAWQACRAGFARKARAHAGEAQRRLFPARIGPPTVPVRRLRRRAHGGAGRPTGSGSGRRSFAG